MPSRHNSAYWALGLNILLVAAGQLALKRGAMHSSPTLLPSFLAWLGISALASAWVWLGILFHLGGFAAWLHVLRRLPLNLAFTATSVIHVLIPLGAWGWLGESVGLMRWGGIALILAGTCCIAKPLMRAEEAL